MFTIDASVHINALNRSEVGSAESQAFLNQVYHPSSVESDPGASQRPVPTFSPTLLMVEVAAAVACVLDDTPKGIALAQAVYLLPGQVWVSLDEPLAEEAARLGANRRLRGTDAIYAAVASRYDTTLVTLDQQQLARLTPTLTVWRPAQALAYLTTSG